MVLRKQTCFRNWVKTNDIDASMFNDVEFLGQGVDGLVMKCSIPWKYENNVENFTLALKMIINLCEITSWEHTNLTKNEYNILSDSALGLQMPHIVTMFGKFESKPTNNMINYVNASIRDLCYRADGTIKGAQFFMLQCYEKTLERVIKEENLSKEKIVKYGVQISRALLYLYESKIAHLDVKLDNIMLTDTDDVVLLDFTYAAKLDDSFNVATMGQIHLPGNISHLSPEITEALYKGMPSRDKTKIYKLPCKGQFSWELGVILFEMISGGELPWDTDVASILHPNEARLNERLAAIPEEFQFLKNLICIQEDRMDLIDAWKTLELLHFNYHNKVIHD